MQWVSERIIELTDNPCAAKDSGVSLEVHYVMSVDKSTSE